MIIEQSTLRAELHPLANQLVEDGFTVYYLPAGGRAMTWLIFGKADDTGAVNVGTAELEYFGFGIDVFASIRPTPQYGSGVAMQFADPHQSYQPYPSVLEACRAAAQPTVCGFDRATHKNHGIEHFNWCADKLVTLTRSAAASS